MKMLRFRFPSVFISLAIFSMISACSEDKPQESAPIQKSESYFSALEQSSVSCSNLADCDPAVGMLVVQGYNQSVGVCTAFLISNDMIVTNSHCLGKIQENDLNCSNMVGVHFPASFGQIDEKALCEKIVSRSEHDPYKPTSKNDYSVIKLSKSFEGRSPIVLGRTGFSEGQRVRIVKIDPVSVLPVTGVVKNIQCRAIPDNILAPYDKGPYSPIVALADCPIVNGNSGSPVINSDRKAIGILQAGSSQFSNNADFGSSFKNIYSHPNMELGYASNVACLKTPLDGPSDTVQAECAQISDSDALSKYTNRKVTEDLSRILESNKTSAELWVSNNSQVFNWTGRSNFLGSGNSSYGLIEFTPLCFANIESVKKLKKGKYKINKGGPSYDRVVLDMGPYVLKLQTKINSDYQLVLDGQQLKYSRIKRYYINSKDFEKTGKIKLVETTEFVGVSSIEIAEPEKELKLCSASTQVSDQTQK